MIYKIYPLAHWMGSVVGFIGTFALFNLLIPSLWWAMLISWFIGNVVGIACGSAVLRKWPRAMYVNSAEIDGTGYVHSNGNWIIAFTLFILLVTIFVTTQ